MAVEQVALQSRETLRIDLLVLDLTTCARCLGAERNLELALETVRDVVQATGTSIDIDKTIVESEEQARMLGFVSSPTIRIDGHDVALELRESVCGSEACTDACGDDIACRVWVHRGREYTEPPVEMIVDAILGRVYGGAPASVPERAGLPENLVRYFARPEESACCSPAERESCCDAEAKAECCDAEPADDCGCR